MPYFGGDKARIAGERGKPGEPETAEAQRTARREDSTCRFSQVTIGI
jgi:hypothetical protein